MKIDAYPDAKGVLSANQQAVQNLNTYKKDQTPDVGRMGVLAAGNVPANGAFSLNAVGDSGSNGIFNDKENAGDFARAMEATDVQIKHDYMSVMSLSMSDEDYAEMAATGRPPEDMDASDAVTILDEIKTALIKGGTKVTGYTDTVDPKVLEQITGSAVAANHLVDMMHSQDVSVSEENVKAIASAVDLAGSVLPISEDALRFMLADNLSPTIEHIYQASHGVARTAAQAGMQGKSASETQSSLHTGAQSASHAGYVNENGYLSRRSGSADIELLRPQIEETIEKSGLGINDKTLKDAEWLLANDLPLTAETMLKLDSWSSLRQGYDSDAVTQSVVIAVSAGIPATEANLTYDESIYTRAEKIVEDIASMPAEAADLVADRGQELNLRNLKEAAGQTETPPINLLTDISGLTQGELHARRVLEEVRLSMTVETSRMMLRLNLDIEITPMEELVDSLKEAELRFAKSLFASDDTSAALGKAREYSEIRDALDDIRTAPAALLGKINQEEPSSVTSRFKFSYREEYTLEDVRAEGAVRRSEYLRVQESYETLMTSPRADLGDSIKKAFANVDDILKDLGMETDELNRRAVRILGYNSIEISEQNVEQIREADIGLRSVINRLTPDRVLNMIREDVNPLNMPIQELSEYLDGQDREPEKKAADYAKFLMQLERREEITELERDSYIGIYRMISSLDRTEDAAIGRLLAMGSQISFSTLLSAMRSTAKGGMDYSVGDDFAGVNAVGTGARIDAQIDAAFSTSSVTETVIENLLQSGNEVSVSNAEAMNILRSRRGSWYRSIAGVGSRAQATGDRAASYGGISSPEAEKDSSAAGAGLGADPVEQVIEAMNDRSSAITAYTDMLDRARQSLSESILNTDNMLDIRSMQAAMKQINILSGYAQSETYDLPMEFDGEMTSVRLTLRHEAGITGRVRLSLETISIGTVAAEFNYHGSQEGKSSLSGYIAYESSAAFDRLSSQQDEMEEAFGFKPALTRIDHINTDRYDGLFSGIEAAARHSSATPIGDTAAAGSSDRQNSAPDVKNAPDASDIESTELYAIAKDFIRFLRKM